MYRYIIRRVLAAVPTIVIVSVLVSLLIRLQPGDVIMNGIEEGGTFTPEQLVAARHELGLDRPWIVQYQCWVLGDVLNSVPGMPECDGSGLFRGDFGTSLDSGRDVLEQIGKRSRISIQLSIMAMSIAVAIALPLGIISAVKQDSWIDYVARFFSVLGLSIPDYFIATLFLYFLSVWVGWLPTFGYFSLFADPWNNFKALIFPAVIVGYRLSAISARMTRSAMLEVLRQDYVRTARSKGLTERVVIIRHSLRNALIPVITIMGAQLSHLLGGVVIIEIVFSLPGLGTLGLNAINVRDYPTVQGVVLLTSIVFVSANLLVDLSYALIDPRIRYA
jgi:peptide/nickel transport system permease protein